MFRPLRSATKKRFGCKCVRLRALTRDSSDVLIGIPQGPGW